MSLVIQGLLLGKQRTVLAGITVSLLTDVNVVSGALNYSVNVSVHAVPL